MAGLDLNRLANVFGADVVHDEAKASVTLTHQFGGEDFLRGHFPGFPVVPGVILLDGMTLAAAQLFGGLTGRACNEVDRITIDIAAFYRPVLPGMAASFTARADMPRQAGHGFAAKCSVMIGGTRHARASMSFRIHGDQASPSN
ncbi:3-hydroxyacyl-ACP dehydratase FabZ family protein [Mesorhizobium sp. 1B3]|uniref:3-hydroxyacyl-ACP dehydratase FabZ family protein n=1 Tax=Mesorhizobium sp. 1B3 TaxID=3243599 RepID=UPI003D99D364